MFKQIQSAYLSNNWFLSFSITFTHIYPLVHALTFTPQLPSKVVSHSSWTATWLVPCNHVIWYHFNSVSLFFIVLFTHVSTIQLLHLLFHLKFLFSLKILTHGLHHCPQLLTAHENLNFRIYQISMCDWLPSHFGLLFLIILQHIGFHESFNYPNHQALDIQIIKLEVRQGLHF